MVAAAAGGFTRQPTGVSCAGCGESGGGGGAGGRGGRADPELSVTPPPPPSGVGGVRGGSRLEMEVWASGAQVLGVIQVAQVGVYSVAGTRKVPG